MVKKFKQGDRIIRQEHDFCEAKVGETYTVDYYDFDLLHLKGLNGSYEQNNFKLANELYKIY